MRIKEKLPTPPATTGVSYRELLHQNHQEAHHRALQYLPNIEGIEAMVSSLAKKLNHIKAS